MIFFVKKTQKNIFIDRNDCRSFFDQSLENRKGFSLGIAERREREKLQRRNSIIEAAEYVFMTKGFEQSTMDDIAHKSELSKGTLYLYFQSKIELCLSIVLKGLTIILQKFQKVQAENLTGIEQIQVFIEVFLGIS